jgi:Na+/H+-translocating membrane pyrophosphatase
MKCRRAAIVIPEAAWLAIRDLKNAVAAFGTIPDNAFGVSGMTESADATVRASSLV